jgi:predicted dehydrogenase/threonine dehydrogenase-like Zn-dependent dehydrogenase
MKQVIARAGKVEVIDSPIPSIGDNEILVKTLYSVISSGTETWTIQSTQPIGTDDILSSKLKKAIDLSSKVLEQEGLDGLLDYARYVRNPTVPLGYSLSGIVVRVGKNVRDLVIGDRVACAGEGKACHAEYAAVPRNLAVKVPEEVDMSEAAFTTLGAIALHGFRTSGSHIGEVVGVIGAGLVGNLTIQVACAAGCTVVAIDQRNDRLELAKQSGATIAMSPTDPLLVSKVQNITSGRGLDTVIICAATESSEPVNLAAKLLRDKGVVTIVGRVGMKFERKDYYQKEIEIRMSRSLGPGRYDQTYEEKSVDYPIGYVRWTLNRNMEGFLQLLKYKKLNLPLLVASRVPIDKAPEAYSLLEKESRAAVLLQYSEVDQSMQHTSLITNVRKKEGAINIGLVGPGNFAKEIILPLLRRNKNFNLRWVIASNPLHARQIAERYHFERFGTSYEELLQDKEVDLVIITTPNNLHHEMTVKAAKANKAVFVEKPLCLNKEELQDIAQVQRETGVPIVVGFNRRYSPLVVKLKEEMKKLSPPFMINYRVNADFIPMTRWVQDPEIGGGRVIAECCHFIDLFNFLLDSYSPDIYATSVTVNNSTTVTRDNIVLVLKYQNGSVSTLTYSALGNRSMERERIEVFGDNHAFVLDDFKKLVIFTPKKVSTVEVKRTEKGHAEELAQLARMLRGKQHSLVSFDEAVASMNCTFYAETILRSSNE